MELIYMYVKKFNGMIDDKEINFSNNFYVNVNDENELTIKKTENDLDSFYGPNIKNITMLLGRNGVGKTSVLDILGMKRLDRLKDIIKGNSYFLLYDVDDNNFIIETTDMEILNSLKNIEYDKCINIDTTHTPTILKLKIIGDQLNIDYITSHDMNIVDSIKLVHITRNRSERLNEQQDKSEDVISHPLLNRVYKSEAKKILEYKYGIELNKDYHSRNFNNRELSIEISCNIEHESKLFNPNINLNKEYIGYYKKIEDMLYVYREKSDGETILGLFGKTEKEKKDLTTQKKIDQKEEYILDFLSRYILVQLIDGILLYDERARASSKITKTDQSTYEHILEQFIEQCIKENDYMEIDFRDIGDIRDIRDIKFEFDMLLSAISYIYSKENITKYNQLIYISRYLHSKMKISYSYQCSIENFIRILLKLDEEYFINNKIIAPLHNELDEIKELLDLYDYYNNPEDNCELDYCDYLCPYDDVDDYDLSDLPNYINIEFNNLSEGERAYFKLYSKIYDELESTNKKLTILLLDEPEETFHPEWSRSFIYAITNMINKYNCSTQVVVSTHSPFMVSDIISDNVYLMKKDNDNVVNIENLKENKEIYNTFGSNIHDILKSSFILNRTIGEFSYDKIKNWIKMLRDGQIDNINPDHIDLIGEKIVRDKIKLMYISQSKNYKETNKEKLIKLIEKEQDEEMIKYIIKKLEK